MPRLPRNLHVAATWRRLDNESTEHELRRPRKIRVISRQPRKVFCLSHKTTFNTLIMQHVGISQSATRATRSDGRKRSAFAAVPKNTATGHSHARAADGCKYKTNVERTRLHPRPRRKTRTLRYPFGKNTFQNLLVFHVGFIVKMFSFRQTHAVVTSQQFHHDLDGQKHWPGVVNMLQYTHVQGLVTDLPLPLRRAARWGHCLVKLASPNRPLYSHVCRLNSWNPFLVTLSHWGWVKMALGLPHGLCDNAGPLGTAPSAHIRSEFTAQYQTWW